MKVGNSHGSVHRNCNEFVHNPRICYLIEFQKLILIASVQRLQSEMEVKILEHPFFNVWSVVNLGAHHPISFIHRIDSIATNGS